MDASLNAEKVKFNGWRQGSILTDGLVTELAEKSLLRDLDKTNGKWVVLSHDCDVTNHSLTLEPNVEVIFGAMIDEDQRDGNKELGKSGRVLQSAGSVVDGVETRLEFSIHDRICFARDLLLNHRPSDLTLKIETVYRLAAWVAKRYTRRGFADDFNARVRPCVKKLPKKFKKNGDVVSAIYLLVDDDEKPVNEAYEIEVWVVMRTEDYKDLTKRDQATGLLNDLESAFESATGIDIKGTDVKSEQDVSLDDIRVMKRWDFDDLTLKDGLQEEIVLNE